MLTYDSRHMRSGSVNNYGLRIGEMNEIADELLEANNTLNTLRETGEQGFFDLPYDDESRQMVEKHATRVKDNFKTLIVIGIGGSDLGARCLLQSLKNHMSKDGVNVIFLGNPDPDTLHDKLKGVRWATTAINVVSKSGTTLETMSMFMLARQHMVEKLGENHGDHIFVTTDPDQGVLYDIAQEHDYQILPHPLNVGGRFAVLSVVGLFPAACAGIDIKALLDGARKLADEHDEDGISHAAAEFAAMHYLAYTKRGQDIHVLMPYASRLENLGAWFRQLWAESLGKIRDGEHVGPTPVAALGAVDQHSQIQLYNQGPNNKVVTFIEVDNFDRKTSVPETWSSHDDLAYMAGKSFEEIMHAERRGTADALAQNDRPNGTIGISEINPQSIGALLYFYELAVAYMGELFGVDAYNQPGVEDGKVRARKILSE
jgi:glucose-6-phosphate isomerase